MNKPKYDLEYFIHATPNKTNWIRAIKLVIWEYENNIHERCSLYCAFCQLISASEGYTNCDGCIMHQCTHMHTYYKCTNEVRIRFWKVSLIYIKSVHPSKFKNEKDLNIIQQYLQCIDDDIYFGTHS